MRIKTSIAPSSSAGQCSSFWWYFHQIFCLMSLYLVNFPIKIYNWTGPDWCIFSRGSDSRITFVCPFVHYREILWQVNMTKFMHLFHSFKCRFLKYLHLWLLSIKLDNLIFDIHEFIKNNNGLWNKILYFFSAIRLTKTFEIHLGIYGPFHIQILSKLYKWPIVETWRDY